MPEASEFLCGEWVWDPALRELRHYERRKKGWAEEPDAVERLNPVRSVTWYRWSQAPMQTSTGQMIGARQSRVVAAYEGGGDLTIEEPDRDCAEKIAGVIAAAYGLQVSLEGAPGDRRAGNLPTRDQMGRLVFRDRRLAVTLDEVAGRIEVTRSKRFFGKSKRSVSTTELRRLELVYEVKGPLEKFTVVAVAGPEEQRLPLASYEGYEGWADPEEWRRFTDELGRSLGAEVRINLSG